MKNLNNLPADGLAGLKENWKTDALSGFLVFLLLSLGIAKASGFPAAMGVLTAIVGGMVVSIFAGSRLTIKGPAAGLITVCAAACADLGSLGIEGVSGVQLACGAIVVMALIQVVFGLLKFGNYSEFFPHSVVHGMLAAIGLLIFAKQFPILLGIPPELTKGLSPIELYGHIPSFIAHANPKIALIGVSSLTIVFLLPAFGGFFKKIPAPMAILLIMIPVGIIMHLNSDVAPDTGKTKFLVSIGDFWKEVKFNASFAAIGTGIFWKYVLMFLFVNSLESLLTVKAIDGLDPFKRKSNYNKDLKALALGNGLSGLLGGLPMISEVARSAANVNNGAKTRWANFFHGLFLFLAMLLLIPVIEMIPNAALAAMLIGVAYRLSAPKEFIGTYRIGPEQLLVFCTTIVVTIAEDLLMGVATGIVVKIIIHLFRGAPLNSIFKASISVRHEKNNYLVSIKKSALFSNYLGIKRRLMTIPTGANITIDMRETRLIDFSVMDSLHHFKHDYDRNGGRVDIVELDEHRKASKHELSARIRKI